MLEMFKETIPYGIRLDAERSTNNIIYLIIDNKEYNTLFSQMGIINFIELSKNDDELIIFYCVGDGDYFTAKEFRTHYGYDNRFL